MAEKIITTLNDTNHKLEEIKNAIGGGDGIPEAPEDGKTYGRKDGDWTEVTSGSGGGNDFIIMVSGTMEQSGAIGNPTIDKTFDEITSALAEGKNIFCKFYVFDEDVNMSIYAFAELQVAVLLGESSGGVLIFSSSRKVSSVKLDESFGVKIVKNQLGETTISANLDLSGIL